MANELQYAACAQAGIPAEVMAEFIRAMDEPAFGSHGIMVARHGQVVAEGYWNPYDAQRPRMVYSLSKSFCSTAVGFARQEGLLRLEDKVVSFFPEEAADMADPRMADMTIFDLLTMNSGHDPDPTNEVMAQEDWVRAFFGIPLSVAPGQKFVYNTAATYMCSAIVQKLTGQRIFDYLIPRLFQPLGIDESVIYWSDCPRGICQGGTGLHLRTPDIIRFGLCLLQKGQYGGRQVIPADWVALATARQVGNASHSENPDWNSGYGFQFWRMADQNAYRGDGMHGQFCLVYPDQDMVVAITAGERDIHQPLELVRRVLLPALDTTREGEAQAQGELEALLGNLAVSLPQWKAVDGKGFSGQYAGEAPYILFNRFAFDFSADPPTVTLYPMGDAQPLTLHLKPDAWSEATLTGLDDSAYNMREVLVRGGWKDANTYQLLMLHNDTPVNHIMNIRFDGDAATVWGETLTEFADLSERTFKKV